MGSVLNKKRMFEKFFAENDLSDTFKLITSEDSYVFKAIQSMKSSRAILLIVINDSIYTKASIIFGHLDHAEKKDELLRLFNELNNKYKVIKFFLDEDDDLTAELTYFCEENTFDVDLFFNVLINVYKLIENEEYAPIMKVLWS